MPFLVLPVGCQHHNPRGLRQFQAPLPDAPLFVLHALGRERRLRRDLDRGEASCVVAVSDDHGSLCQMENFSHKLPKCPCVVKFECNFT